MQSQSTIFLPNQRNPFFTGHERTLQTLLDALRANQRVVLSGTTGLGKTSLALEFAYRFSPQYQWIIWLNASNNATLLADILTLAPQLGLTLDDKPDFVHVYQTLQDWFANHQQYLLILDNVADVRPTTTPEPLNGHVLLLTRTPATDQSITHITLTALDEEDAALWVLRQTALVSTDETLEQANEELRTTAIALAHELNGLPLAINLASLYIKTRSISIQDYLALYREYAARLVQLNVSKDKNTDAIAITCSLPVVHLRQQQPAAAELLWSNTVLAPTHIPQTLFTLGAAEQAPEVQNSTQNHSHLDSALAPLFSFGLLVAHETPPSFSMQPTVQATLCAAQPLDKQQQLASQAIRAFYHLLPSQEQTRPADHMHMAIHIHRLASLSSAWDYSCGEPGAEVLCWAASLFWEQELIVEAELVLRNAFRIWEHILGIAHPTVRTVLQNLAILNALLQNYPKAEELFHYALRTHPHTAEARHSDVISCLIHLARIYKAQDKLTDARACYQKALKFAEPTLPPDDPLLTTAVDELALLPPEEVDFA
jgi:tetratricopeptide (TPR) repeat protein